MAQSFNPGNIDGDSWAKVLEQKKGTISVLWNEIDPFIYRTNRGKSMEGVEYEIMESFAAYIRKRYNVTLAVNWVDANNFENIYPFIAKTNRKGIFGWSYFSITNERKKEVQFTPAYMPDVNIIVTNIQQPLYASPQDFITHLAGQQAFTTISTTMEKDVQDLKNTYYSALPIHYVGNDYEVMQRVSETPRAFGYVPLSIYVKALEKGFKVKRQLVLSARREGFAGIYPINSDWAAPVNEYFNSKEFALYAGRVIKSYLGSDISSLIFKASLPDSLRTAQSDNELLSIEKDIVSKNLIEAALDAERQNTIQNAVIATIVVAIIFIVVLYGRSASKQRSAVLLQQRNNIILQQKSEIELMNKKLEMKVLLAQINPHLVFNSLNAIQYFVSLNDKKNATLYISNFSRYLRQILANLNSLTTTLEKEVKLLSQYLELEQLRFENKFDFSIHPLPAAADRLIEIPSMLIYPFVETALYQHVLIKKSGRGNIAIHFDKYTHGIIVTITDNGEGGKATESFLAQRTGDEFIASLKNVMAHIDLINYESEDKITITQNEGVDGCTVIIKIPLVALQNEMPI